VDTARIAALLEPFIGTSLTEVQLQQISTYIDLLQHWNARINLTAVRKEEEIVTRHFGESLFMARHLFPEAHSQATAPHVLDIGSGAGFPALPLKLWAPQIHLTLIESNHKKAAFLREVARTLTLTNVNVITERAEVVPEKLTKTPSVPRADVVSLRAVEHLETVLPQAIALLAPTGSLALLISTNQLTALTTLKWNPPIRIPSSVQKILSIGRF
jgi:16S rRNA (guanine527-N7)-methyltransferase